MFLTENCFLCQLLCKLRAEATSGHLFVYFNVKAILMFFFFERVMTKIGNVDPLVSVNADLFIAQDMVINVFVRLCM